ncbi:hypothetical protein K4K56_003652 [Colletotrichum sp. SAR 10_98]|nr:hypothetical protein K4K56_003652 [Colletotrichum sp. SAR 10_98]
MQSSSVKCYYGHCSRAQLCKFTNAASVSAINIHLHVGGGRGGNTVVCTNINPNTCCGLSGGDSFPTAGFRGIPTNWNLECMGHSGDNCNNLREVQPARDTNFVCLYSGGGYGFAARKRAEDSSSSTGGCANQVKPDTLLLEDGGKYDIAGLEGAPLTELVHYS